jgi:hypothetical protein
MGDGRRCYKGFRHAGPGPGKRLFVRPTPPASTRAANRSFVKAGRAFGPPVKPRVNPRMLFCLARRARWAWAKCLRSFFGNSPAALYPRVTAASPRVRPHSCRRGTTGFPSGSGGRLWGAEVAQAAGRWGVLWGRKRANVVERRTADLPISFSPSAYRVHVPRASSTSWEAGCWSQRSGHEVGAPARTSAASARPGGAPHSVSARPIQRPQFPGRRCTMLAPHNPSLLGMAFLHDQDPQLPSVDKVRSDPPTPPTTRSHFLRRQASEASIPPKHWIVLGTSELCPFQTVSPRPNRRHE